MSKHSGWFNVTLSNPCPICGKKDWCGYTEDGIIRCMRIESPPKGFYVIKKPDLEGGTVFRNNRKDKHQGKASHNNLETKKMMGFKSLVEVRKYVLCLMQQNNRKAKYVKQWEYRNKGGSLAFVVMRFDTGEIDSLTGKPKKEFRPAHKRDNLWYIGDPKKKFPLYGLDKIQKAPLVFVCEGEKAADTLRDLGLAGITWHGSNAPHKTDWSPLEKKNVILLPDNDPDEKSMKNFQKVIKCLSCYPDTKIKIVHLPNLPPKGDAVEFLGQFNDVAAAKRKLVRLARNAKVVVPDEYSDHLIVRTMSDVESTEVEWLWANRFPLGKLSILAGDPGLGKSFVTLCIAAHVTTGKLWPDGAAMTQGASGVVLLNAEDDPADTIRPRLDAHNADCTLIDVIEGTYLVDGEKKEEKHFSLEHDLGKVKNYLQSHPRCRLIIVDPINAYLAGTDAHRDTDIRGVLTPLTKMAAEYKVTILVIMHFNKSAGNNPSYRIIGSIGYVGAARSVWVIGKDPKDHERRLMVPVKNNLGPDGGTGMAFRIVESKVSWEPDPIDIDASELFDLDPDSEDRKSAFAEACMWLEELLSDGPILYKEIKSCCKEGDISLRTLRRAMRKIAESKRIGFGPGSKCYWRLKGDKREPQ